MYDLNGIIPWFFLAYVMSCWRGQSGRIFDEVSRLMNTDRKRIRGLYHARPVVGLRVYRLNQLSSERPRSPASKRGFTLLELLVVIVIIGLLAAYVGPRYFSQLNKSERQTTKAQIEGFGKALDAYRLDTGHYPGTEQGLNALVKRPSDEPKWNGPYLQKDVPPDPWGRAYVYRSPGQGGADFDLQSNGKDGQPGGDGDNVDITYR
ncbi:MAG: gspG [Proteobacteria bacterium]|nr:gspG [Pseudomonadota bacterium]